MQKLEVLATFYGYGLPCAEDNYLGMTVSATTAHRHLASTELLLRTREVAVFSRLTQ